MQSGFHVRGSYEVHVVDLGIQLHVDGALLLARVTVCVVDEAPKKIVVWPKGDLRLQDAMDGEERVDHVVLGSCLHNEGVVFAGHLDGNFRAYESRSGKILWSYDTRLPVKTISGAEGKGGGMSGPGAAVAGGYVVVNSGYGLYYHMPGNVLLVFAPR